MKKIASFINKVVTDANNENTIRNIKSQVKELCDSFPIYENLLIKGLPYLLISVLICSCSPTLYVLDKNPRLAGRYIKVHP